MQCPQSFCGNGIPTFGQFHNNQVVPFNTFPEIIGEGEVLYLTLPDGTVQFFFIPTTQIGSIPFNFANCYPIWNTNKYAWYIRNYPKPASVPVFVSQLQRVPEFGLTPCLNGNTISPEFNLKFHNDSWTSTTDLRYFIPGLPTCNCPAQKCHAITQMDIPVATNICHYQFVCSKPCHCSSECSNEALGKVNCQCSGEKYDQSPMAVDSNSEESCNKAPVKAGSRNSKNMSCECKERRNGKTINDKGSSCVQDVGCATQCCHSKYTNTKSKSSLNEIEPEIWIPKTPLSRKAMKTVSYDNLSTNNSESCNCNS